MNQSKRNFRGGLMLDDNIKALIPEDYLYALNCVNGTSTRNKGNIVQNTQGNRLVSYTLPSGTNKVIGFFEDKKESSGIYFVYNSLGNHSILRYYPDTNLIVKVLEESVLNFQDFPIVTINLVDNLLSWTTGDGNPPREFNIERAQRQDKNGVFKKAKFNIYFDFTNFRNGDAYRLFYGTINTLLYVSPSDQTLEDGITDMVAAINATQTDFHATSCGQFIEVEFDVANFYDIFLVVEPNTVTGNPSSQAVRVFTNIYPDAFLETFINADRNPPECEPSIVVKTDSSINTNFIVSKIFQFRLAYRYVDNEKSSLSPISIVSLGVGNYIEIDFTDSRLNDENLTIIKNVEIYVKEGELGKWKFVDSLDQFEFGYNPSFPAVTNYFKFYNDKAYNVVDDAYAIKLFESFPIEAEAQEVAANRKMYGGIKEGYDQECVDLSLSVAFNPPPELYTIKGIAVIRPLYLQQNFPLYSVDATAFNFNSAFYNYNGTLYFGIGKQDGNVGAAESINFGQATPLGGFVFYLAGTDFYGVSKQIYLGATQQNIDGTYNTGDLGFYEVLSQNTSNTQFDYGGKSRNPFALGSNARDQEGNYIGDKGWSANNGSNIYSKFEIKGVPEGEYILRIAGNETTLSDLSSRGYQKTSTYAIAVGNAAMGNNNTHGFEMRITVSPTAISYNAVQAQNNQNTIYVGCSAVADLSRNPFSSSPALSRTTGYLCDSDLTTSTGNYDNVLTDTRIERALVQFQGSSNPFVSTFNSASVCNWSDRATIDNRSITDHNGFFYHVSQQSAADVLTGATVGSYTYSNSVIYLAGGNTPQAFPYSHTDYVRIAMRNDNSNVRDLSKTYIDGFVLDGTSPQANVPVINTLGSWGVSDQQGYFKIPDYIDTYGVAYGGIPTNQRVSRIVFSSPSNSIVYDFLSGDSVFIGTIPFGVLIDAANYNNTSPPSRLYHLNNWLVDLLEEFLGISAFKRGLNETFAVIYYDRENRQTTVQEHISAVYVPFYTENQTEGFAQISWAISSLPPDWATHYQIVRQHTVPSFIQFNANSITYEQNNTRIKIGTQTILDYATRYPNSQLTYTWQQGDRIRFISNGGGNLFPTYLDAEIVYQEPDGSFIRVDRSSTAMNPDVGTLFEIYTPRPSEQTLFYEFGECFEIYEDNGVKYHRGQSQDQTALQNAEGTFQTGDVYYRFRNFTLGGARYIEDTAVSDFYESFTTQTGRPQILDKNAKQVVRPTLIRFSNPYFSGSQTNGFASFEALNQKELDRVFGTIQVMELMAQSVLIVVCEQRTQTFYINKATINIPSNTPNLISLSDAVLNQADTLIGEWGTQHRSSFASYNNNAWWWDESKGQWIRYSSNGLFPVSDYGVKSYFKDKGLEKNTFVSSGYDPYFSNLYCTLGDETIAFNDGAEGGKNRWTSFFSFLPEVYGRIDNLTLTFKDGSLYVHDSVTRNNFFGTQYASIVETSVNDAPSGEKIFQSVALESKDVWHLPVIRTNEGSTYPNGMLSRLLKTDFKRKNNMWFADLKGNMLDPYVTSQLDGLINGEKLRGEVCILRFQNDLDTYTELYGVNLYSTVSLRTPV